MAEKVMLASRQLQKLGLSCRIFAVPVHHPQKCQRRSVNKASWPGLPPPPHQIDESEDEIERKRNISRLPDELRKLMHKHQAIDGNAVPMHRLWNSASYKQRMYARYGRASGIDPSIMWPSVEEVQEMMEDEKQWEPTLQEMWAKVHAEDAEENNARLEREEEVEKQMSKMPEYIAKFKKKLLKQQEKENKESEQRRLLLEEIRDYFGYNLDPADPRVLEMQEAKAEEELKLKRMRRKEEKQAKLLAHMQYMATEAASQKAAKQSSKTKSADAEEVVS